MAEGLGSALAGGPGDMRFFGWDVSDARSVDAVLALAVAAVGGLLLYVFFRTNLGTAMQAAGDNAQMIRALGVNVDNMIVLGLAVSNGLVALAGALLAQYQGFADVQMGIGMVVWGLASIIIGEALVGTRQIGLHHHRRRDGLGALPPAGRHRPARRPQPQRPEARHRRLRVRRPRAARSAEPGRTIWVQAAVATPRRTGKDKQ